MASGTRNDRVRIAKIPYLLFDDLVLVHVETTTKPHIPDSEVLLPVFVVGCSVGERQKLFQIPEHFDPLYFSLSALFQVGTDNRIKCKPAYSPFHFLPYGISRLQELNP
jgi:hypothetical protein